MVSDIPPLDPHALLYPLLACLPTAFVSPRPPPALLPLLSPILRQRVHHLSATATQSDSWLTLLSWDRERAAKLPDIVESMHLEPHPVSGEIELEDIGETKYRRLDEETIQARLDVTETSLAFLFVWCATDEAGGGPGWRLAELRALEDAEDGTTWYSSITEAEDNSPVAARRKMSTGTGRSGSVVSNGSNDDDDYWNAYDRTPGRTPAKRSPAPPQSISVQQPSEQELEYFARYMSEVQPAMDPHDPDEQGIDPKESTLHGNIMIGSIKPDENGFRPTETDASSRGPNGYDSSMPTFTNGRHIATIPEEQDSSHIEQPRPSSISSSEISFAKLERKASIATQAEVAIKQHISTNMKSLFRLARAAGIEQDEFERIIKTELDCLSLMEAD